MVADLLFWAFFGLGFLVMIVMILIVFRTILEGRKGKDAWRTLGGKSSLLQK